MNAALKTYISPEEYLERENTALEKSEYYNGEIFAMAGAKPNHVRITSNLTVHLANALRGKDCEVFPSDLRVNIPQAGNLFTYPDISVVCGKSDFSGPDPISLLNPTLIIEVLSDSTANYDRREKFALYRQIFTLKEYMLVNQKQPFVEVFFKNDSSEWIYSSTSDLQDSILLKSLDISLPLVEIYERVEFEEPK
ncbi:MAG: Uma2 family endonuclease [Bacteroidota bacterium]